MKRANFSIITFIIVDITFHTVLVNANKNFCTSTECIHASASILERINVDINPCDNFYDFCCGEFIDDTLVPDERISVDVFGQLKDNIDQQLYSFVQNHPTSRLHKLIHGLYTACMDNNNSEGEFKNLENLKNVIHELGGWPLIEDTSWNNTNWTLDGVVRKMREKFGSHENQIFQISPNILAVRHAYFQPMYPSESYSKYRKVYHKYIKDTARVLSNNNSDPNELEIIEMLNFEYKLNELNYRLQQTSTSFDLENESEEFSRELLQLQWFEFFHQSQLRNIYLQHFETECLNSSDIVNEIKNLLSSTDVRTQANFLIWRIIDYAGSVAKSVKFLKFQLERTIYGKQDMEQSWKECINVIENEIPYAIGWHFIIHENFNMKKLAIEMFNDIKYQLLELVNNSLWIDEVIRGKLNRKLENLVVLIGYPTGFNESDISAFYSTVKNDGNQYLRTLLQLRIIDADNKFRQIYAPSAKEIDDIDDWKKYLPPISFTAVYSDFENSIRLPYSLLMNIINQEESLRFLNYGTIGFIIGHEISHIVNQFINEAKACPEMYRNEFTTKKQCVIRQYDTYQDPETLKNLDGKRTLGKNIADLTGIKLAYGAFKRWVSNFNSTHRNLIGVNFTQNQLFWIVMAQKFCGVYRTEEMERKITSDIYATERFRVIGIVENSPDFSNDFECSESTRMNRANKCVIW